MSTPAPSSSASAAETMRAAGLRVTESRSAVFAALQSRPHASADDVLAAAAEGMPRLSIQSVYNALGDFADAGIARRIEPAGQPMRFELRTGDNHHHLICTSCGAVEDVECAVGHAPCLLPSGQHGYTLAVAEVTYWGICPACAAAAQAAADITPETITPESVTPETRIPEEGTT